LADLAIVNAKVWTGNPARPAAEAVAVRGDRIEAVGGDADIRAHLDPGARIIDAAGRRVVPGFIDAHAHVLQGGFSLLSPPLRQAADERQLAEMIRRRAQSLPPGTWITGGQWDHEAWPGRALPTRQLIDPVTPEHPVLVSRLDGHVALANSLALQRAGIDRRTPDPPGGAIRRDAQGEPTGILIDAAKVIVDRVIPEPDEAQRLGAARAALRHLAELGVTGVHAPMDLGELSLWRKLREAGELTVRIYAMIYFDSWRSAPADELRALAGDPLLHAGAVKVFADGSLGGGSALFFEPYCDNPQSTGLAIHGEQELYDMVRRVDAAGMQVALHAIGDKAVHWALNAFERAAAANGRRDSRHRIEHAQMVRPEDRGRFAPLGVVASIQPSHCIDDMRWVARRMGGRTRLSYPFRSLLAAGARVAAGSDWPVEPVNPMLSLYAAITREFASGGPEGGWHGEEKVTVEQALAAQTLGAAFAEFREQDKGAIEPGKLADLVMLSDDVLQARPQGILATRAEMTLLGGQIVFERESR